MTPLFLLRHGPTAASMGGAPLGRLDLPVSPEGQAAWPGVKAHLMALGLRGIATSDLTRARDHALDLGSERGLGVRVLPGLAEQDFGAWDGVPWAQLRDTEAFFADPVHGVPPGGESFADCARRAQGALEELILDEPILILAHGGSLRAILATLLGMPLDRAMDLGWDPFGLSRVDVYGEGRGVLKFHNRQVGT